MNKIKIFSIAFLSAVVIYSCKDKTKNPEPTNNTPGKSKQEYLSEGLWKIQSLIVSGSDYWSNPFIVKDCNKDNTYKFKTNNILTGFDTPLKCDAADPDSTNSAYKLISDSKMYINLKLTSTIIIDDTSDVNTLDGSTLQLKVKYSGLDGVVTFKH